MGIGRGLLNLQSGGQKGGQFPVPPEKQDWLKDVQASLRKRLYLTKAQAQGVENWFKHIPGHQPLSPKGFQWTWPKTRSTLVTAS